MALFEGLGLRCYRPEWAYAMKLDGTRFCRRRNLAATHDRPVWGGRDSWIEFFSIPDHDSQIIRFCFWMKYEILKQQANACEPFLVTLA